MFSLVWPARSVAYFFDLSCRCIHFLPYGYCKLKVILRAISYVFSGKFARFTIYAHKGLKLFRLAWIGAFLNVYCWPIVLSSIADSSSHSLLACLCFCTKRWWSMTCQLAGISINKLPISIRFTVLLSLLLMPFAIHAWWYPFIIADWSVNQVLYWLFQVLFYFLSTKLSLVASLYLSLFISPVVSAFDVDMSSCRCFQFCICINAITSCSCVFLLIGASLRQSLA